MNKSLRKHIVIIVLLLIGILFQGCQFHGLQDKKDSEVATDNIDGLKKVIDDSIISKEIPIEEILSDEKILSFNVSYKTGLYKEDACYPIVDICTSYQDYVESQEGLGLMMSTTNLKPQKLDETSEKVKIITSNSKEGSNYDEKYFKDKSLIVITIEESSSSINNIVKKVSKTDSNLTVEIEKDVPEICLDDMVEWTFYIEVDKNQIDKSINTNLIFYQA